MALPIEPLPITEPVLPPALTIVPDWVPLPDSSQPYFGPNTLPSWDDVYNWIKDTWHALPHGTPIPGAISTEQVQQMIDSAVGQTVKAMSGFVNQAVQFSVDQASAIEAGLENEDNQRLHDELQQNARIQLLENQMNLLVVPALPDLYHQIDGLKAQIPLTAEGVITIMQKWVTGAIAAPLLETIGDTQTQLNAKTNQIVASLPGVITNEVAKMGLATAASLAPVAAQALKAANFVDECGEEMCATQGPNTDVGKLLKALKLAADAGLLVELLALTGPQIVALMQTLASHFAGLANDFGSFFGGSGETLSGLLTAAGAAAV